MSKRLQKLMSKWSHDRIMGLPGVSSAFGILPSDIWNTIIEIDPTPNHKYVDWALMAWARGTFKWEDIRLGAESRVAEQLKRFETNKHRITDPTMRSLLKYKGPGEMDRILDEHGVARDASFFDSSSNQQKKLMMAKARLESHHFEMSSGVTLDIPISQFASCILGRNTRWCTAASKDNHFEDYASEGALVIIGLPTGQRFQAHCSLIDFADPEDIQETRDEFWEAGKSFTPSDILKEIVDENGVTLLNADDSPLTQDEKNALKPYLEEILGFISRGYASVYRNHLSGVDDIEGYEKAYAEQITNAFLKVAQPQPSQKIGHSIILIDECSRLSLPRLKSKTLHHVPGTTHHYSIEKGEHSWTDVINEFKVLSEGVFPSEMRAYKIHIKNDDIRSLCDYACKSSSFQERKFFHKCSFGKDKESQDTIRELIHNILTAEINKKEKILRTSMTRFMLNTLLEASTLETIQKIVKDPSIKGASRHLYISSLLYKSPDLKTFFQSIPERMDMEKQIEVLQSINDGFHSWSCDYPTRLNKDIQVLVETHLTPERVEAELNLPPGTLTAEEVKYKQALLLDNLLLPDTQDQRKLREKYLRTQTIRIALSDSPFAGIATGRLFMNPILLTKDETKDFTPEQIQALKITGFLPIGIMGEMGEFSIPSSDTLNMATWKGTSISHVTKLSMALGLISPDEMEELTNGNVPHNAITAVMGRIDGLIHADSNPEVARIKRNIYSMETGVGLKEIADGNLSRQKERFINLQKEIISHSQALQQSHEVAPMFSKI